jgi:UDP-3-O-[3-hydroxymyristoyl] glucosamine N-acyltransferase
MADPRFFKVAGPFTLKELADLIGAELSAGADAEAIFEDVAPLSAAGPRDVSFLDNKKYVDEFKTSQAGACIVEASLAEKAPEGMGLLISTTPYSSYALAAQAFYPEPAFEPGVSASASIDATAHVPRDCLVEAGVVVGPGAKIGARCRIGANTVIGQEVVVGENTSIGSGVHLSHCLIGARVLLHPGVCIGQRGFGFAMAASGHIKVPQLGRVVIEDDVEIGANSTIDRGSGPDTVIGAGSMIDNLVQIGHNVCLGRGCVIVAQAGVAGSTRLEEFAVVAAQGGVSGHLVIGKGAQIGAKSGVMRDVAAGEKVAGIPAVPVKEHFRQVATLKRLASRKGG